MATRTARSIIALFAAIVARALPSVGFFLAAAALRSSVGSAALWSSSLHLGGPPGRSSRGLSAASRRPSGFVVRLLVFGFLVFRLLAHGFLVVRLLPVGLGSFVRRRPSARRSANPVRPSFTVVLCGSALAPPSSPRPGVPSAGSAKAMAPPAPPTNSPEATRQAAAAMRIREPTSIPPFDGSPTAKLVTGDCRINASDRLLTIRNSPSAGRPRTANAPDDSVVLH